VSFFGTLRKTGRIVSSFQPFFSSRKNQLLAKSMKCHNEKFIEQFKNQTTCNNCSNFLREIKIPPEEMFLKCKFRNRKINCTEFLKETINGKYLCYTFNEFGFYRGSNEQDVLETYKDWTIDEGYKPNASVNANPYRALGAGLNFGFSTLLRSTKRESDNYCSIHTGFLVSLTF
jgi:Amiloride-sensitive sodium channel